MIYNAKSQFEANKARKRLEQLIERGKPFELTDITKRSNSQNSYVHLCLGILALELGYTLEYVKLNIWKMTWLRDMFYIDEVNKKTGEIYKRVRSSAELSKEEMSKAIEVLLEKASSECGVVLPNPNDQSYQDDFILMQREIYNNQQYLT
jgi:hypothetical protein